MDSASTCPENGATALFVVSKKESWVEQPRGASIAYHGFRKP